MIGKALSGKLSCMLTGLVIKHIGLIILPISLKQPYLPLGNKLNGNRVDSNQTFPQKQSDPGPQAFVTTTLGIKVLQIASLQLVIFWTCLNLKLES